MVDKTIIRRKIAELETYLGQVKEYSGISVEAYQGDWKTQRIVERTLQMMIETCADIAGHIVSDQGMRPPTSYADTFKVLLENAIIEQEHYIAMEKMAKFRNIVVHQYEGIDAAIVIVILKKHLADFERFRTAMLDYLHDQED